MAEQQNSAPEVVTIPPQPSRSPRFAELDAQIQAEGERRQDRPEPRRKPPRHAVSSSFSVTGPQGRQDRSVGESSRTERKDIAKCGVCF